MKLSEEHKKKISNALKGKIPKNMKLLWEKRKKYPPTMLGKHHSEETKRKISLSTMGRKGIKGKDSPHWKGDKVGYDALHDWLQRYYGKANHCENCHIISAKRYEWANISGKYKRNISDWKQLCSKCHKKFDKVGKKVWLIRKGLIKKEMDGKTKSRLIIKYGRLMNF